MFLYRKGVSNMTIKEVDIQTAATYVSKGWNDSRISSGIRVMHIPTRIAIEYDVEDQQYKNKRRVLEWLEKILNGVEFRPHPVDINHLTTIPLDNNGVRIIHNPSKIAVECFSEKTKNENIYKAQGYLSVILNEEYFRKYGYYI